MDTTVKIQPTVIISNRSKLSNIGANLGGCYFRIKKYPLDETYGEQIATIRAQGNKDICLNRGIYRFVLKSYDIHSVEIKNDADGTPSIFINEGDKDLKGHDISVVFPLAAGPTPFLDVTEENVRKALESSDQNIIFSDPTPIVDIVNRLNNSEKARLEALSKLIGQSINSIDQSSQSNLKRVQDYQKQLRDSAHNGGTTVVGHVEIDA